MTSANPGMDPVVMAFRRGNVTVGGATCAVKGIAEPSLIRLSQSESAGGRLESYFNHSIPLSELEARIRTVDKIRSQGVDEQKDHAIEGRICCWYLAMITINQFPQRFPWK